MIRHLSSFILCLGLLANTLSAQVAFENFYECTASAKINLIELPSTNLFTGFAWGPGISRLDQAGNLIGTTHFWSDSILLMQSVRQNATNEYYFVTGYRRDTCSAPPWGVVPRIHPVIGRMDSTGAITRFTRYELSEGCLNMPVVLEFTSDGGLITWGGECFAMKASIDGDPVWARHFNTDGGIQFVKELPGGDLLAGMNIASAGAVLARLDAGGNMLWCKSYIRPRGMVHDAVIESNDAFIITGYTDSTSATDIFTPLPPDFKPKLFMMKVDGTGEVQWCRGYDSAPNYWSSPYTSRILETLDGRYAVLATLGQSGSIMFDQPFLMKTDLNGDTLWTRSTRRAGYNAYGRDLLAASDSGYLFSGIIWGDLPNNNSGLPYILKTDPLGNFPCSGQHHPIALSALFPIDSTITLSTTVVGVEAYIAYVTDTIFDPITQYNGCTNTTTGSLPGRHLATKPRLYPNPTPGRFTVEFADPLMAESYYSLFDTMGKLLLQRPLPTGATVEEVDLTRFGAGSYVIKFTSPDGVCYERVVVE